MSQVSLIPGNKPALIVLDVLQAYTDPRSPLFTPSAVAALDSITSVVRFVRREGHPIFFTRLECANCPGFDAGLLLEKIPALRELQTGSKWSQYAEEDISPQTRQENLDCHQSTEIVRPFPSAFFGTSLEQELRLAGCDTVFIVGFTTSGAVRATVIDALQSGLRPFVVRECVADKVAELNRVHLLDIQTHWGEVVSLQQAVQVHADMRARGIV
jgi:maleamate amidohydrolase